MSEEVLPGAIPFTIIPRGYSRSPKPRVIPTKLHFDIRYGSVAPRKPPLDATLRIFPPFPILIQYLLIAWHKKNGPLALVLIIVSHVSSAVSNRPEGKNTPALFT